MIYLVSKQQQLFNVEEYSTMTVEDSLALMKDWEVVQLDTETTGRDPHLCDLLCVQFGNDKADARIVVDTSTVDIKLYKEILETKLCILQNAKFDLQFFFNYGIIIRKVYDTMIVEQLLHLGYPPNVISYSLASIAYDRLGINVDKTVRGEIIWRGLDERVLIYAAGDVTYLEKIMASQIEDLKKQGLIKAAQVENRAVPSIAYLEWCGIHLDEDKWKDKMKKDLLSLKEAEDALNKFVTSNAKYSKYTQINRQGSLFDGFDTEPKCTINWSSSRQVVEFAKLLGFNVQVKDKKTGEDKESVLEKHLKTQRGINDEFLKLYFDYQEHAKVVSSFGQGHLNAVNPKTGRLHTTYRQLGTLSGRLSSGSQQPNTDLAKFKGLPAKDCTYPNMQQLPHDEITRACFTAPKDYSYVAADFSAEESRLGADIYQDKAFLKEFLEGSGDTHSMFAWAVFRKECEECGCREVSDVAKLAKQWRQAVKAVEFAYMFKKYL